MLFRTGVLLTMLVEVGLASHFIETGECSSTGESNRSDRIQSALLHCFVRLCIIEKERRMPFLLFRCIASPNRKRVGRGHQSRHSQTEGSVRRSLQWEWCASCYRRADQSEWQNGTKRKACRGWIEGPRQEDQGSGAYICKNKSVKVVADGHVVIDASLLCPIEQEEGAYFHTEILKGELADTLIEGRDL